MVNQDKILIKIGEIEQTRSDEQVKLKVLSNDLFIKFIRASAFTIIG